MNVDGRHFRTIWAHPSDRGAVQIIDQRALPFRFRHRGPAHGGGLGGGDPRHGGARGRLHRRDRRMGDVPRHPPGSPRLTAPRCSKRRARPP
ncbi:MAG: hypothetical protein R3F11_13400 [Verrucomicrobiales bacterium]